MNPSETYCFHPSSNARHLTVASGILSPARSRSAGSRREFFLLTDEGALRLACDTALEKLLAPHAWERLTVTGRRTQGDALHVRSVRLEPEEVPTLEDSDSSQNFDIVLYRKTIDQGRPLEPAPEGPL